MIHAIVTPGTSYAAADAPSATCKTDNTEVMPREIHIANLTIDNTGAKTAVVSFDGVSDAFTLMPAGTAGGRSWVKITRCTAAMQKVWIKGTATSVEVSIIP